MIYEFECAACKKKCRTRRGKNQQIPSYCSFFCYREYKFKFYKKPKFSEKTEEKKAEHLKKYFEKNIVRKEGCWDWTGKTGKTDKYPRMNHSRSEPRIMVHIYSWIVNFGEIKSGMLVCHTCDNPRCANPAHLFLGTYQDNMNDCKNKGRRPSGINNAAAKLDDKKVKKIKQLIEMGVSMKRIAKDYNVNATTIERIKKGTTWKHVQ